MSRPEAKERYEEIVQLSIHELQSLLEDLDMESISSVHCAVLNYEIKSTTPFVLHWTVRANQLSEIFLMYSRHFTTIEVIRELIL